MPAITVTFHEEGQEPAVFVIPAQLAAVIQAYVDSFNRSEWKPGATENDPPILVTSNRYNGSKTQYFLEACMERVVRPMLADYSDHMPEVAALRAQKAALDDQIQQVLQAAVLQPQE